MCLDRNRIRVRTTEGKKEASPEEVEGQGPTLVHEGWNRARESKKKWTGFNKKKQKKKKNFNIFLLLFSPPPFNLLLMS